MQTAHDADRWQLQTSLKRMKRDYNIKGTVKCKFHRGDVVHLLDTAVLKGMCRKLCRPWMGPAVVIEVISALQLRKSMFVVNHDRMKSCKDRNLPKWGIEWLEKPDSAQAGDVDDSSLYCWCCKPWHVRFMILCDGCDEWFHGACVDVTPTEALNIDQYHCASCLGNMN